MKRILMVLVLMLSALGVLGAAPGRANPSDWCADNSPGETQIPILSSPVYIAAVVSAEPRVQLCYRSAPGAPGVAGGSAAFIVNPRVSPSGGGVWAYCGSDPGVQEPVDCNQQVSANASPGTSGTSVGAGGATIGLQIPFQVCVGPAGSPGCTTSSPNLAQTGVIVAGFAPMAGPTGSTGAAYQVSSVQVWLNGALLFSRSSLPLGGGYVNYTVPTVSTPALSSSGVCVTGGVCLSGMLGVNSASETVTLVLPTGTSTFPVTIPSRCLINFSGPC